MTLRWIISAACLLVLCDCSNRIAEFDHATMKLEKGIDLHEEVDQKMVDESTLVTEVINMPAFDGFGQFLFPSEASFYGEMTLDNIDALLPYHSHMNKNTTVEVINTLLELSGSGEPLFYDIYTKAEKEEDISKKNTGVFFLKGEEGAPFAIISAGGGFAYVGSIHESLPHALELSKNGYNAFVLQYRTGGADMACEDLAAAISFVFENADMLSVSTEGYSLWGGSAGARMAAYLGSYGPAAFGGGSLPRPAAVIMQYTGHSDYTENDPPTYVCVGENDGIANWHRMERRIRALDQLGIDTEFHHYPNLGHGFGLGIGTSAEGWINDAIAFWERHME